VDDMKVFEDEAHHTVDLIMRMDGEAHD
jgi:hypothetical protein